MGKKNFIKYHLENIIRRIPFDEENTSNSDSIFQYRIKKVYRRMLSTSFQCEIIYKRKGKKSYFIKTLNAASIYGKNDTDFLKSRILKEYNNTLEAYHRFPASDYFHIIKPICVIPDQFALITELVENALSVEDYFKKKVLLAPFNGVLSKLTNIFYLCGKFLGLYHKNNLVTMSFTGQVADEFVEYLSFRIRKIRGLIDSERVRQSLKAIDPYIESIIRPLVRIGMDDSAFMANIHGDFSPSNILYNGSSMVLIDFADSKQYSRYQDVGGFLNYLDMLNLNKFYYKRKEIEILKQSFLDGYTCILPVEDNARRVFVIRYLVTNLITQLIESKRSWIKKKIFKNRIQRYIRALETQYKNINIEN